MGTSNDNTLTYWITVEQAAEKVAVSPSTIRRWAREGRIASANTPTGHLRIDGTGLTRDTAFSVKVDRIMEGVN